MLIQWLFPIPVQADTDPLTRLKSWPNICQTDKSTILTILGPLYEESTKASERTPALGLGEKSKVKIKTRPVGIG